MGVNRVPDMVRGDSWVLSAAVGGHRRAGSSSSGSRRVVRSTLEWCVAWRCRRWWFGSLVAIGNLVSSGRSPESSFHIESSDALALAAHSFSFKWLGLQLRGWNYKSSQVMWVGISKCKTVMTAIAFLKVFFGAAFKKTKKNEKWRLFSFGPPSSVGRLQFLWTLRFFLCSLIIATISRHVGNRWLIIGPSEVLHPEHQHC